MSRLKMVAGNWKMNGLISESKELLSNLTNALKDHSDSEVVICPPFHLLDFVKNNLSGTNLKLGAQDCHFELKGAFTGDISPLMLKDIGCEYVILGHSERRKNHFETNYLINKKAKAAITSGLKVIVCVGETKEEKEAGKTLEVNVKQVKFSLPNGFNHENTIIAYEPVWAIGTSVTPTLEEIQEVHKEIRETIKEISGEEVASKIRILYGGSVKSSNSSEIFNLEDVDGGLIGGASLIADEFTTIVKSAK